MLRYRKKTLPSLLLAAALTSLLLCGAVFAGAAYPAVPAGERAEDVPHLAEDAPSLVYEAVEVRRYEGEDGHRYIHKIKTNRTAKAVTSCQTGMLAFDKDGNPLEIDWFSLDSDVDSSFFYLFEDSHIGLAPGETEDEYGGWSLNPMGNDPAADRIVYVLYCDKEVVFDDGSRWVNPGFDEWRSVYEGQTVDTGELAGYYPHVQPVQSVQPAVS